MGVLVGLFVAVRACVCITLFWLPHVKGDTSKSEVPILVRMLWLAFSELLFKAVMAEANSLEH